MIMDTAIPLRVLPCFVKMRIKLLTIFDFRIIIFVL